MVKLNELISQMKKKWSVPRSALHRSEEIPFKLCCSFNSGVEDYQLSHLQRSLPREVRDFYILSNGAALFVDEQYGQWGLKIYSLDEIANATQLYFKERSRDCLEEDLIIGEFFGDTDLLLIRCDPRNKDFGSVVVVSAINPRVDWDIAASDFAFFLQELYYHQGDKYWEVMD